MADLVTSLKLFYEQAERRHLFWQDHLPFNPVNGRYFCGLNLLLLGTHPLNYQDPRWVCADQLQEINQIPESTENSQNIISWQDEGSYNRCRILTCYNIKELDISAVSPVSSPIFDTRLIDDLFLPYNRHPNTRYDALNRKILINREQTLPDSLDPLIRFYLQQEKCPKKIYLRPDLYSDYLQYVFTLTKVRLLQLLDQETFYFDSYNLILETIKRLYQQNHHLALLYGYIHSDKVINAMFKYEKHQLKESVMTRFMPEARAYQLLNRLTRQHLNQLTDNMNKCLQQDRDRHDIAYLHFVSVNDNEKEDFYVTNLQDNCLFGVIVNERSCFYQQLKIEDVDERYILDILFTPKTIS